MGLHVAERYMQKGKMKEQAITVDNDDGGGEEESEYGIMYEFEDAKLQSAAAGALGVKDVVECYLRGSWVEELERKLKSKDKKEGTKFLFLRSVGKTQMNEQSSRSHFVFTLRIYGVNESTDQQVQGILNLIDLAGSKRLSKSGSTGDRLKETQLLVQTPIIEQPCLGGDSKILISAGTTDSHLSYF
ncbi:hypothetical protein K1719_008234 [Acacia pycnantha]|nr:hypothetical protein K1719_008234 [Acacia pycnantha]